MSNGEAVDLAERPYLSLGFFCWFRPIKPEAASGFESERKFPYKFTINKELNLL
jgi:hypothetical protein